MNSRLLSLGVVILVAANAMAATPSKPLKTKKAKAKAAATKKVSVAPKKATPAPTKVSGISKEATSSAAISVPAATSVAVAKPAETGSKPLPLSVQALNMFYGPNMTSPGSGYFNSGLNGGGAVGDKALERNGIYLQENMIFKYKLNPQTSLSAILDFNLQLRDGNSDKTGEGFFWNDSFLKLSRAGIIEAKVAGKHDFALDGDLRYYAPTSKPSRDQDSLGSIRLSMNPSLQFGKSPISISSVNYARYYLQTHDAIVTKDQLGNEISRANPKRFRLYTGPQVNYSFNDNVTAFVLYEALITWNTLGIPSDVNNKLSPSTDVEPGVDIKLHDRVTLTPYLNWYPRLPISTTSINLNAMITLL